MWSPPASGTGDHRWPNVDRTLDRQPWDRVREILREAGVSDLSRRVAALRRYVELLVQWNRSVSNLISKNDEERIVLSHLVPSIEPVDWMKSRNLMRWCDLGSGGGFPAIPLVLCGVGESWDLVESRRTKCLFLRRAVSELGLGQVRVLVARIEDLVGDGGRGSAHGEDRQAGADGDGHRVGVSGGRGAEDDAVRTEGSDAERQAAEKSQGWGAEHGGAEETEGWDTDPAAGDTEGWSEPRPRLAAPFDGFTSRATMALAPTLEFATSIVRPGGEAFLWKGSRLEAERTIGNWRDQWTEGEVRALSAEHSVIANFIRSG